MTNHTEARLAREAEIAYSTLAMVTDYDCWHPDHDAVTVEMVINNLRANATTAQQVVRHAVQVIQQQKPASPAHSALQNGLLTAPAAVPAATRRKLDLFTRALLGGCQLRAPASGLGPHAASHHSAAIAPGRPLLRSRWPPSTEPTSPNHH